MNDILWWAAQNAVATALLVPVVWLIARLRRSRPAELHLLWLLLLAKLLTPPVVLWPWSADEIQAWMTAHDAGTAQETPTDSATIGPPTEVGGIVSHDPLPAMPENLTDAVALDPASLPNAPIAFDSPSIVDHKPTGAPGTDFSIERIAGLIWLTGAFVVCLRIGVHVRTQRRIVRTAREAPSELRSLVETVASRLGIGQVAVRVSNQTGSPFVSCLGRPVLVWPEALADGQSIVACEGVVAHELAHVRRRDHWVAWLEAVAAPLWWWNPVFWYVRRRLDETRELACDALALELTASDRRKFAELLLAFSASGRPSLPFAPLRTGIAPRHSLRRRLAMLFDKRVSGRVSFAGLLLSGLLAAAALPGWAWGQEEPATTAPVPETAPVPDGGTTAPIPATEAAPAAVDPTAPATEAETAPAATTAPPAGDPSAAALTPSQRGEAEKHRIPLAGGGFLLLAVTPDGESVHGELHDDGQVQIFEVSDADALFALMRNAAAAGTFGPTPDDGFVPAPDDGYRPARPTPGLPTAKSIFVPTPVATELIYFTASWSDPSQKMKTLINELSREGIPIRIIDVDQQRDLIDEYGVTAVPTLVVARNGKVVGRLIGVQREPELRRLVANLFENVDFGNVDVATPPADSARFYPEPLEAVPLREEQDRQATGDSSQAELRLLRNALQLAELEVEAKKVLLEQAREENKRQQALFDTGATSERPRDLRLLEIELKKAELQAEQARIRLEAAQPERRPGSPFGERHR